MPERAGELQNPTAALEQDFLAQIGQIDPSVQARIDGIQRGLSLNGHNPNGVLSDALTSDDIEAHKRFIDEYDWALNILIQPYSSFEEKEPLKYAALDGLYAAGETYDPDVEPNFLTHLSNKVRRHLNEVFGKPADDLEIPIDAFDQLVIEKFLEASPPLASTRQAENFETGMPVLHLVRGELRDACIKKATAYTGKETISLGPPIELSEQELALREAAVARRQKELDEERKKPYAKHSVILMGLMPDPELLRLKMACLPQFQQVIKNPSPGIVHIVSETDPVGLITDMHHNTIITLDAWEKIKESRLYRQLWLENGSTESLRQKDALDQAISARIKDDLKAKRNSEIANGHNVPSRARLRPKNIYDS